jgi:hypothetical protein
MLGPDRRAQTAQPNIVRRQRVCTANVTRPNCNCNCSDYGQVAPHRRLHHAEAGVECVATVPHAAQPKQASAAVNDVKPLPVSIVTPEGHQLPAHVLSEMTGVGRRYQTAMLFADLSLKHWSPRGFWSRL